MNTLSPIEFSPSVSAKEAMEAVEAEGAIAIHDFLPNDLRLEALREMRQEAMYTEYVVENTNVKRHQNLSRFGFAHGKSWLTRIPTLNAPSKYVHDSAQYIADFVNSAEGPEWRPNEIIGHEYRTGQFLDAHRDYKRAIGFVAVATLDGMQDFNIELDSGETANIFLKPGTVTIMRGYQGEAGRERPLHSVEPAKSRRLAFSLRQMSKLPMW